jgi:N-acetyl-gamma-glutamyl-phosphate reductase
MNSEETVKVGIIGASGYSGEELIRLLLKHAKCKIVFITSRKYDGVSISEVFPRFAESKLKFVSPDIADIKESGVSLVFLALPHGLASEFAIPLHESGLRVVDISADFRLSSAAKYKEYYKQKHPAPELLTKAVYGLPELYRKKIKSSRLVACPGCYPTSILLPLVPLLKEKLVSADGIVVLSGSGVSGAGRKVDVPYIYPECNESFRAYAVSGHRHLPEIEQELEISAGKSELMINFIPHLVPMNRGINSTLVLSLNCSDYGVIPEAFEKYYGCEPFVRILSNGKLADTKHVTMSNICEIGYAVDTRTNKLIVTSAIDNLTKGAAGQAIQCMNIMYGIDEREGLE